MRIAQVQRQVPTLAMLALVSIAVFGTSAFAAEPSQPQRTVVLSHDLPNVPGDSLTSLIIAYPPGAKSPPHHHAASSFTFVYVLTGSIRSQVEGEPEHVYQAGQHWFELPGAHHVISENASATEPASMLVVMVAKTGDKLVVPDR